MVLEMVLESLFAVVDVFWVGRLGANAIAHSGADGIAVEPDFCSRHRTQHVDYGDGRAAHREKDSEGAAVAGVQAIVLGWSRRLRSGFRASFMLRNCCD